MKSLGSVKGKRVTGDSKLNLDISLENGML